MNYLYFLYIEFLAKHNIPKLFGDITFYAIPATIIFIALLLVILALVLFERKLLGWFTQRKGPNRVGLWGILQTVADALKLLCKENITPKGEAKENTLEEKAKENNEISKEEKEEAKETLAPVQTNNVEIKFMGESWVELKNKDKVYFQGVFHKGDVKSVNYVPDMFISVGRPVNVEIYVKGVKKNLLAKRRKTNIPVDSLE